MCPIIPPSRWEQVDAALAQARQAVEAAQTVEEVEAALAAAKGGHPGCR